jgi:hypothetical protein
MNIDRGLSAANAQVEANQALKKIKRAMSRSEHQRRSDILSNGLYSQMIDAHIRRLKPPKDWIPHLVEWEGRSATPGAKQRAIQLLSGERPNSRKNRIELQAVALADKIRSVWFVSRPGRPHGARNIPKGRRRHSDDEIPMFDPSTFRLAIRDIVQIAARAIGDHAGAKIDLSNLVAKAALKAAILILRPDAERSIDRAITAYLTAPSNNPLESIEFLMVICDN